jgi:predicted DNA-binding transcriptional regulator YafY
METWLAEAPAADAMPVPHRRVEAAVLRALLAAIRERRAVEILYQSMNPIRPEPAWRWITPHAFGNDSLRWHVRAFCHIDKKFKDFLLSRCLETRGQAEGGATSEDDVFWNETFAVLLSPNPALSKSQQQIIAQDYNMTGNRVSVSVRKALLYYFQKRLRLDSIGALDEPHETPVVIKNQDEFRRVLAEATA